ncbi:claudin 15-like b isoform X2 [Lepisosteus oculatus]|uniref:Claudin n=1 Tax=Lepisosteus oculatus TaxID=7918 RepID=W5MSK0_LEPOC|nr:PREDICTED: claudin-10-like isoform X2 [Lepisosteus oculatus]
MSTALELSGFLLCIACWLLTGVSLSNDYWKVSSYAGSANIFNKQYENLWMACVEDSTSVKNCRDFMSMMTLPAYIQGCRALMIISLVLGLVAVIVSMMGLKCTKIGSSSEQAKGKIALVGGSLFITAGLTCLVATSWYASQVVKEFYDPFYGGTKFELGAGLYIGWGGACLGILGGAFLCCSCRRGTTVSKRGYDYSIAGQNAQKIYKTSQPSEVSKAYV